MRSLAAVTALYVPLFCVAACTPLESASDLVAAGGVAGAMPSGNGGSVNGEGQLAGDGSGGVLAAGAAGEGGAATGACPEPGKRETHLVSEAEELTIDADTTWTCQHDYRVHSNVIVAPGARLTIDAGVTVAFDADTLLLVQRGASIDAQGTQDQPITFTSARSPGMRAPGDYRGLILSGNGPSQTSTTPVQDSLSSASRT